jgi:LAO/AO transport system ATPase
VLEPLLERFRQGDRLALARLLSLAARGQHLDGINSAVAPPVHPSRVIAITGSGGVGKSTLIGKLIEWLRERETTVAVLACDPQSPLSGGALLGDRFRMAGRPTDDGVFIRSLSAPGGQGAVARHLDILVRLLEASGFAIILIETVGAGQGDTAVRDLADVVVLLLQPETGDDLQWEKAGLLEVADVVAIHKADLPGADRAEAQVRAAVALADHPPTVLRLSAKTSAGLDALGAAILEMPLRRPAGREDLLRLAADEVAARFAVARAGGDSRLARLLTDWRHGRLQRKDALATLWHLLGEPDQRGESS